MQKSKIRNSSPVTNWNNLMVEFPKMKWKQDGFWKGFDTISDYRVVLKSDGDDCDGYISVALEYFGNKIYYNNSVYVNNGYTTCLYRTLFNGHVIGIWESMRDDSVFVVSNRRSRLFNNKDEMWEWFEKGFEQPSYIVKQTKDLDVLGVMDL